MSLLYGIVNLSVIPVRRFPADNKEMVNQLLFGECIYILDKKDNWFLIKSFHDNYEGWIDSKQILIVDEQYFEEYKANKHCLLKDYTAKVFFNEKDFFYILTGSTLPFFNNGYIRIGKKKLKILSNDIIIPEKKNFQKITDFSMIYLNTPYLWGGRSIFGIDCSAFVQNVYRYIDINLPRDASMQAELGRNILLSETKCGDLAFFKNNKNKITHVGIILNKNKIIHAFGKVRIDLIDHQGIFNRELSKYTHKLAFIKSFDLCV